MTQLWVLRANGEVIACAPDRTALIGDTTYGDGAYRALDQVKTFFDPNIRYALQREIDAESRPSYTHGAYTLALEPHPTPVVKDYLTPATTESAA